MGRIAVSEVISATPKDNVGVTTLYQFLYHALIDLKNKSRNLLISIRKYLASLPVSRVLSRTIIHLG